MKIDGFSKIRPDHKAPHIGEKRPFRSTLFLAFLENLRTSKLNNEAVFQVLSKLIAVIDQGRLKPFFDREEINNLMQEEILKVYGGGRYFKEQKLDNLNNWHDLLTNMISSILSNREFIQWFGSDYDPEKLAALKDLQHGHRKLKIIEDWIFYNRDIQQTVRSIIAEQAKGRLLLKPEYQKEGRPTQIKSILVVDDNIPFLELVNDFAIRDGLKVDLALTDPKLPFRDQVKKLIMVIDFDLIIMDGQMPDINGDELTQELRQMGYSGYIFANTDSEAHRKDIMLAGADSALEKKTYSFASLFQK